ncbi:MAG TPA: hypothetical protein VIY48_12820 [Candidatus Paceibacterota bacterium]
MANNRSMKDKTMAAMLKKLGVTRTTGQCPWGCGRSIPNGGGPLVSHLGRCKGPQHNKRVRKA